MQRQKSILSFLQKPKIEKPVGGGAVIGDSEAVSEEKIHRRNLPASNQPIIHSSAVDFSNEIIGTDTPPEKEKRPLFSSIKHKFVKPNSVEKPCDRYISM